jgi:hypothetical protein
VVIFMVAAQLPNHSAKRIEDRVKGVAVARQDHPCRKRTGALSVEGVERQINDFTRIAFALAGTFDRFGNAAGDPVGDHPGKRRLKPCRRPEVVKQIGVGAANAAGNCLQRDRNWSGLDQKRSCGFKRGGTAMLGRVAPTRL